MNVMPDNPVWHLEVLPPDARDTFAVLANEKALKLFYLAGGTALALQWGHRLSVDLDFFSESEVHEDFLIQSLEHLNGVKVVSKAPETLHLHIRSTKVSFIGYHYAMTNISNKKGAVTGE